MDIHVYVCENNLQSIYDKVSSKSGKDSQYINNRYIIDFDNDKYHMFTNRKNLKMDLSGKSIVEYHVHCDISVKEINLLNSHKVVNYEF